MWDNFANKEWFSSTGSYKQSNTMNDITKFNGTFDLESKDSVDEYLKETGSSFIERKSLCALKPVIIFSVSAENKFPITINQAGSPNLTILSNSSWIIQLEQPFEADFFGREMKTTYIAYIEGEKIVSKNVADATNTISIEMVDGEKFTIEFSIGSVRAKRIFKRTA